MRISTLREGESLADVVRATAVAGRTADLQGAIGIVVEALADAAKTLSARIAAPAIHSRPGAATGGSNTDGDMQRELDVEADALFTEALFRSPVSAYVSEEAATAMHVNAGAPFAVAIDPLDGSSNIDVNAPIGTIFSIMPAPPGTEADADLPFRQFGRAQLAAGFFIYGSQTSLVVCLGAGVHLFTLDRQSNTFVLVSPDMIIPPDVSEYAINTSNYRHWHEPVQRYIDDCVQGNDGPDARNHNMRWIASLVADSYRIFMRGGVFLYPDDKRKGYERGRLRHLYEANPIAFLAEKAGGAASDCVHAILDLPPKGIHDRVPFVMGSADKVARIRLYHVDPPSRSLEAPLFGRRGLMRV